MMGSASSTHHSDPIILLPPPDKVQPDGCFVPYSIGWNETDDSGVVIMKGKNPTNVAPDEGDWVWHSTPQTEVKSE